jgi:hypothetical protein
MITTDKVDWSYLAGLFDGEGTFSIWRHKGKSSNGNPYDSTAIRIEISNTKIELMKWLVEHFGGQYYVTVRKNDNHNDEYGWRPKGRKNSEMLLLGILPYLVIKKEQAKTALEYIRLPHNNGYDEILANKRKELMLKMKLLNKRGKSVTTNTLNLDENQEMIESDLIGNYESDAVVTQTS